MNPKPQDNTAPKKTLQRKDPFLRYTLRWTILSVFIALIAGSVSAAFLSAISWVTGIRYDYPFLLFFLPAAGLVMGMISYHLYGKKSDTGNSMIIHEIHHPKHLIERGTAFLVFLSTLGTHLFGGSAGREGTSIQMSASLIDRFTRWFRLDRGNRSILLIVSIAAAFGSVFGTPLTGAVFGLEVAVIGRMRYEALYPAFLSSILANYVTQLWGVGHQDYIIRPRTIEMLNDFGHTPMIFYAILCGVIFGLGGRLFVWLLGQTKKLSLRWIGYPPLIPFAGGVVFVGLIVAAGCFLPETGRWGDNDFTGLGLRTISEFFTGQFPPYYWLLKIVFTAITLGTFFKGGEVTPLFFIGAALGNACGFVFPDVPIEFLAALGFVGVFAGAANTPMACTFMAIELFGREMGIFAAIACTVAYLFSGTGGLYASSQGGGKPGLTGRPV